MCVRNFVKQCAFMTGQDYSPEVGRRGPKHIAIEDCKHQVLYLVKARNHLIPGGPKKTSNAVSQCASAAQLPGQGAPRTRRTPIPEVYGSKRPLPTPETSFDGKEGDFEHEGPPVKRVDHGPGPEWQDFLEQEAQEQ
jgi:hypothetical protein